MRFEDFYPRFCPPRRTPRPHCGRRLGEPVCALQMLAHATSISSTISFLKVNFHETPTSSGRTDVQTDKQTYNFWFIYREIISIPIHPPSQNHELTTHPITDAVSRALLTSFASVFVLVYLHFLFLYCTDQFLSGRSLVSYWLRRQTHRQLLLYI